MGKEKKLFFYQIASDIFDLKDDICLLLDLVTSYLPRDHVSLVLGMVFGDKEKLSPYLNHNFKVIGMQHILVASGSNISMVVMVVDLLISRFLHHRVLRSLVLLFAIFQYVWLVGTDSPILRATVMSFFCIACRIFFRQYRAWYALLISFLSLTLFKSSLLTDLSFQLSMAASLGVITVLPVFSSTDSILSKIEKVDYSLGSQISVSVHSILLFFYDSLVVTVAAQSFVLPLLFYYFGEFALLSILSNTLLLAFVSLITILGFAYVFLSLVVFLIFGDWFIVLVSPLFWLLFFVIDIFLFIVSFLGQFSFTVLSVSLPLWGVGMWWGILVFALIQYRIFLTRTKMMC